MAFTNTCIQWMKIIITMKALEIAKKKKKINKNLWPELS